MGHTKGPWVHSSGVITNEENEYIADLYTGLASYYPNAHLIAAAPELLAACEYVVQYHRENDSGEGELFGLDFVTTCIAAINKAKGE